MSRLAVAPVSTAAGLTCLQPNPTFQLPSAEVWGSGYTLGVITSFADAQRNLTQALDTAVNSPTQALRFVQAQPGGIVVTTYGIVVSTKEAVYEPFRATLIRHLSKVESVHAILTSVDGAGVVHVYSVAPEFGDELYAQLLPQERAVERKFPDITFDFHVRARQNRALALVAPLGAQTIFVR